jgi:hypothetical protein
MIRDKRWLLLLTFVAFLAPSSAAAMTPMGIAPPSSQGGRIGGITYNGGPVMTGRVNVYVIWYGSFPPQTQTIVDYFIANWGASHSYGVLRSYTGSNGRVAPELALVGQSFDSGSRGSHLVDADVHALVANAILDNTFPADTNGIYLVFIGERISLVSASLGGALCGSFCGYHGHQSVNAADLKFGIIGAGNCGLCQVAYSPNGNPYAEAMVNVTAHEIAETVTDPDLNAWGAGASLDEVGDKCNFDMSEQHKAPNGVPATAQVGDNYYFIQKLWTPTNGGGCYSGYSPPAAVVWQEGPGGAVSAWKMKDQNTVGSYIYYNLSSSNQKVIAVGDFSNDIDPQILTIDVSNAGSVLMTELHADGSTSFATMFDDADVTGWKIVATSDFNGDGFGDLLWSNPSTGDTWLYLMQGTTTLNMQYLGAFLPWLPQGAADFDGDGVADILWVDNADQLYSIWTSAASGGTGNVRFNLPPPVGLGIPILGAADFNGNSRADVLKLRTSDDALFIDLPFFSNSDPTFYTQEYWLGFLPTYPGPYTPPFAGLVDGNRDGTSDFYVQVPGGLQLFTLGNWKTGSLAGFTIAATSQVFGDGDWTVVGTGGFNEN